MTKKVKWGIYVGIAVALVAGGLYTCVPKTNSELADAPGMAQTGGKNKNGKGGDRAPLHVDAVVVTPQTLKDEIVISGSLLPDEVVNLAFEASGRITHIHFKEGTHVAAGQLLAQINDAPLQAQLKKIDAQLPLARNRVERQAKLLERDAVSRETYEQATTQLSTLMAEREAVTAQIRQTQLRAPFAGVVGLRQVSVGAYASPSTVVVQLTKTRPLKVQFAVPERYAGQVTDGTRLDFTLEGVSGTHQATVYAREATIDDATRTLSLRALTPNAAGTLTPGRYVSIKLHKAEKANALTIPTEAIVPEMGKDKVFLYRGGKAVSVEVKTGLRTESRVEAVSGLERGDTVITSGTLQLREGLKVVLDNVGE